MSTIQHGAITGADIHSIVAFTAPSIAARNALTVVASDIGKVCQVTADNTFYVLSSTSPAAWVSMTPALATVATSGVYTDLSGTPALATVAISGEYADLSGTPTAYALPIATASVLGGIKVGSGLSIDGAGVVSAASAFSGGTVAGTTTFTAAAPQIVLGAATGTAGQITGANGGTTANGMNVTITGGSTDWNTTSPQAGTVTITGGASTIGNSFCGSVNIGGGSAPAVASRGGSVNITGGSTMLAPGGVNIAGGNHLSTGSGVGGVVSIIGGSAPPQGTGGGVTIAGGTGGTQVGLGGAGGALTLTGGLGTTVASGGPIVFQTTSTASQVERFRITANGAWSVGSTGTAYGTAGQVLTSNGNAAPTWQAMSGGASLSTANTWTAGQRGAVVALTAGATVTPDFATANNFSLLVNQNFTLANPTNLVAGQSGMIAITQDATGSRVISWGTSFKAAGGTKPVLTTGGGAVDYISYYVESATRVFVSITADIK